MARDYKQEYLDFHASRKAKDRRSELNKINHTNGTYGNNDNEDVSHQPDGSTESEDSSTNKGRIEKSREKGSKRKPFRFWSRKKAEQGILLSPEYTKKKISRKNSRIRAQTGLDKSDENLPLFTYNSQDEEDSTTLPALGTTTRSDNTTMVLPSISSLIRTDDDKIDLAALKAASARAETKKVAEAAAAEKQELDRLHDEGEFSEAPEEGYSKEDNSVSLLEMVANPMKTLKFYKKNPQMTANWGSWGDGYNSPFRKPSAFEWDTVIGGSKDPHDIAMDVLNPFAWGNYASKITGNLQEGEFQEAAFNALGAIPSVVVPGSLLKNTASARNVLKVSDAVSDVVPAVSTVSKVPNKIKSLTGPSEGLLDITRGALQGSETTKASHQLFTDFIKKHHPKTFSELKAGTLDVADLVSDPKYVDDFANRYSTTYRGVAAKNEEEARKFMTEHRSNPSKEMDGPGIYSAMDGESAAGYAARSSTTPNVNNQSVINDEYWRRAAREGIHPYVGVLKNEVPYKTSDDLWKWMKSNEQTGGVYNEGSGVLTRSSQRVTRPGTNLSLEDIVKMPSSEGHILKTNTFGNSDHINKSDELKSILRPTLRRGGKLIKKNSRIRAQNGLGKNEVSNWSSEELKEHLGKKAWGKIQRAMREYPMDVDHNAANIERYAYLNDPDDVDYDPERYIEKTTSKMGRSLDILKPFVTEGDNDLYGEDIESRVANELKFAPYNDIKLLKSKKLPLQTISKAREPKELQESNVSLYKGPKYPTKRVMEYSNKVRTNQIPSHDMVWDKKRNQYVVRNVEKEEIDRYKKENRVRKPIKIKANFKTGGVKRKAQKGVKK